jgi:hypothetical protein
MTDDGVPENSNSQALAPSTIHRWIFTLASLTIACQTILVTSLQKPPFSGFVKTDAHTAIPKKKYKTHKRKECLLRCRWFLNVESFMKNQFSPSLQ